MNSCPILGLPLVTIAPPPRHNHARYDSLYRLTGETISGATINGAIGYQYDPVGNRLQRTSSVAPVPPATYAKRNLVVLFIYFNALARLLAASRASGRSPDAHA